MNARFVITLLLISVVSTSAWSAGTSTKRSSLKRASVIQPAEIEDQTEAQEEVTVTQEAPKPFFQDLKYYAGLAFGSVSRNSASGAENSRDSRSAWGVEAVAMKEKVGAELRFTRTSLEDGTSVVRVAQDNNWLEAGGRYRIWNFNFSPYATAGLGLLRQSVTTTLYSESETHAALIGTSSIGIGAFGNLPGISPKLGIDFAIRYYQYTNVNGFNIALGVGYIF